jgi:hypothetical protein
MRDTDSVDDVLMLRSDSRKKSHHSGFLSNVAFHESNHRR